MKLSMWNIYHAMNYEQMTPMISDGSPTITCARWIVTSYLNSDSVYVGKGSNFFYTEENDVIVVHQHDIILIQNVEPEEVFNEICCIIDHFSSWENALRDCMKEKDGLTKMIDLSKEILKNPSYIYAPDGEILAIASDYPASTHWHWKELLDNSGLTEKRMEMLKETIHLTDVFKDTFPTIRDSKMDHYQYMHCSLTVNGYMSGHFVLFSMLRPFEEGMEYLVSTLIGYLARYMEQNYSQYGPTSKLGKIITSMIYQQSYEEKEKNLLLRNLRWKQEDLYRFYVIGENVSGEPVLLRKLYRKCSESLVDSIVFILEDHVVLMENETIGRSQIQKQLPKFLKESFVCGVSTEFHGFEKCSRYYAQAKEEMRYGKQHFLQISYAADHMEVYFQKVLKESPFTETYVHRSLLQLKAYDIEHHSNYYETLKAFCYCGFQLSAASKMLRIHRNSISYRLEKIRELIDFQEFDKLMETPDVQRMNQLYLSFFCIDQVIKI